MIEKTPHLLLSECQPLLSDPLAALADELADLARRPVILGLPNLLGRACILGRGQVPAGVCYSLLLLGGGKKGCGGEGEGEGPG